MHLYDRGLTAATISSLPLLSIIQFYGIRSSNPDILKTAANPIRAT
jgi:hypothetical protein